jgi:GNAT superfamily N-acetyltransferase
MARSGMEIRDAQSDDATAACAVLRRSITELCAPDHRNDAAILARWLASKKPEIVAAWIMQTTASMLLAVEGDKILAVGGVTDAGEITLNYVSPDARFRGVTSALLRAVEARAVERGNTRCWLISTETAHRFYLARGYRDDGPAQGKFGTNASYRMSKSLS